MAVVSRENTTAILELRSAALTLIAVVLKTTDLDALAAELEQRASVMPGLFDDEPVAVDLSRVRDRRAADRFRRAAGAAAPAPHGAAGRARRQRRADGRRVRPPGWCEAPEGARPAREQPLVAGDERIVEVQLPPPPPLIVDRPLRSGQQVYAARRDLIVLALVSYGAEVIADGHVHVYAPLRGRAIAGAKGNTEARIFTTCMEAQLLGHCRRLPHHRVTCPPRSLGRAAMVRLDGDSLLIDPLEAGA